VFICTYIYMYTWAYTAEVTAKRIRERYFKAILRQDIAFYDKIGPGEVTTRIQTDTRMWSFRFRSHTGVLTADISNTPDLVHRGISERLAVVVSFISAFFTGFILAFLRNWRLTLAMCSILPCVSISGAFMNKFIPQYVRYVYMHEDL